MVKQGDIIKINFSPQSGHEQAGWRPALVVSNDFFNGSVNLALVCPITNTARGYPLHVALDGRTQTTGVVMCEQIKAVDLRSRGCAFIETAPPHTVEEVVHIIFSELERQTI